MRVPAPWGGLSLGVASHLLAGISPFVVAALIARAGLMPATALIYITGLGLLGAGLAVMPARRRALGDETRALLRPPFARPFLLSLAGFLVAGVAYYQGLHRSARVAEYIFLTRLDWVIQAPVALWLLKEPWTRGAMSGGALALTGGLMLAWTGAIGTSGMVAAGVYIAASLAGYVGAAPISAARALPGALTLVVWRHAVNTAGFVLLAVPFWTSAAVPRSWDTVLLIGVGAVVILGLFVLRFAALTRIPLWVLSVQAPVQAGVAVTASWLTEGRMAPLSIAAIALIVTGECLVAFRHRQPGR